MSAQAIPARSVRSPVAQAATDVEGLRHQSEQRHSYAELSEQVGRVLIRSEDLRWSPDAAIRANNDRQCRKSVTIFLRSRLNAREHALQKRPELASEPIVLQDWWSTSSTGEPLTIFELTDASFINGSRRILTPGPFALSVRRLRAKSRSSCTALRPRASIAG